MEQRKLQIAMWILLFVLQAFLAALLIFVLVVQSPVESSKLQSFDLSNVYSRRLAESGQLTADDQNGLLALCKDYEKKLSAHVSLEASMLNEMRGFYWQLLLFLGIVVLVQIVLAKLTLKAPAIRRGAEAARS